MKRKIQNNLDLLIDQNIYEDHLDDLYSMIDDNVIQSEFKLDKMISKSNIDNRKVYYEDKTTEKYIWVNWYLKYIYRILLIALIILQLYAWSNKKILSPYTTFSYSLFMVLYPFFMDSIINGVLYILKMLYSGVPKDVYLNL